MLSGSKTIFVFTRFKVEPGVKIVYFVPSFFFRASKIIFNDKKAIGIEYIKNSKRNKVLVNKEVIICAGAFQSPQLLMVAGIGDFVELKKHEIELVHELKGVGKNLQDHLFYPICCESKKQEGINHYINPFNQFKAAFNYFVKRKGVFFPIDSGADASHGGMTATSV